MLDDCLVMGAVLQCVVLTVQQRALHAAWTRSLPAWHTAFHSCFLRCGTGRQEQRRVSQDATAGHDAVTASRSQASLCVGQLPNIPVGDDRYSQRPEIVGRFRYAAVLEFVRKIGQAHSPLHRSNFRPVGQHTALPSRLASLVAGPAMHRQNAAASSLQLLRQGHCWLVLRKDANLDQDWQ